jgi:hypothetical protein
VLRDDPYSRQSPWAKLLTHDEARLIAANAAKLRKCEVQQERQEWRGSGSERMLVN